MTRMNARWEKLFAVSLTMPELRLLIEAVERILHNPRECRDIDAETLAVLLGAERKLSAIYEEVVCNGPTP